jgi:hypothetical protein
MFARVRRRGGSRMVRFIIRMLIVAAAVRRA